MFTPAFPSIASLLLETRAGGHRLGTATGFIAHAGKRPILLTNRHVVTGRNQQTGKPLSDTAGIPDSIAILHHKHDVPGQWELREEPLFSGRNHLWSEHPLLRDSADIVGLPLTKLNGVDLYPYDLFNPGPPISRGPAESISVVGFPFGIQAGGSLAVWSTGFIASEPTVDFQQRPTFLIDCRSRPGQSGSAVVVYGAGTFSMEDGSMVTSNTIMLRLFGMYSGRVNENSDLGIVWKLSALQQLITSMS